MKPNLIDNTSVSSSLVISQDFFGEDYHERTLLPAGDFLFRVKQNNELQTISVTSTRTEIVRDSINAYITQNFQDIDLLKSVVYWQKKTIDFQALHTALLLNSLSDEDFEEEAKKFTVHLSYVDPQMIASHVDRLHSLLNLNFDTSDYADYFQCTQENIMDGLRRLTSENFVSMLPESTD